MLKYQKMNNEPTTEELLERRKQEHLRWEKDFKKSRGTTDIVINGKKRTFDDFFNEAESLRSSFNERYKKFDN